jgi:ribose/xylose/arabinose/galactoside ABC-type transport system permease subunit
MKLAIKKGLGPTGMVWIILFCLVICLAFLTEDFLTPINLSNILLHSTVLGILAIGETFCLLSGNFDLSVESTMAFAPAVVFILTAAAPRGLGLNIHPLIQVILVLLAGVIVGLINGLLVVKVGINPFLVTLSMMIILRGATLVLTKGLTIYNIHPVVRTIGGNNLAMGICPYSIIYMVILYLVSQLVLKRTRYGRDLITIGGNNEAAKAFGIKVESRVIIAFIISGLLAAFAGLVMTARINSVAASIGTGIGSMVFAAAALGGVSLQGGIGSYWGVIGGVILLGVIDNGLTLLHVSPFWTKIGSGIIIFIAIIVDATREKLKKRLDVKKRFTEGILQE